jgi:hypothetical protein
LSTCGRDLDALRRTTYKTILGHYTSSEDVPTKGSPLEHVVLAFPPIPPLHHPVMSPRTNTQLPTFHDPLIQRVNRAYYRLHTNGTLVGIHGGQLRAYLLYDQALRDDRRPSIQPFGYRQFATLYNGHPNTTEDWAVLDDAGAIRITNSPITPSRFSVEDVDLVDIQSLVPPERTLDDEKAGLLNEMLWGAARRNAANHRSAQQRRAQRGKYEEFDDGRDTRRRRTPKQPAAPIMVPLPNTETPPPAVTANPTITPTPSASATGPLSKEKAADRPEDDDELISLGDEFEPRDPMDIDESSPSTSLSNPSIPPSETDSSTLSIIVTPSTSATVATSSSAPVTSTPTAISDLHFRKTTRSRK